MTTWEGMLATGDRPVAIAPDPVAMIRSQALTIQEKAQLLVVKDEASARAAAEIGADIRAGLEKVEEVLGAQKKANWDAYQLASKNYNEARAPFVQAEQFLKPKVGAFIAEQQRIAAEAARQEALRVAEEQARQRREAEETQRRLDEEYRKVQEEMALTDAILAEAQGATPVELEAIMEVPVQAPVFVPVSAPVIAAPTAAPMKVAGFDAPKANWVATVTDKAALVRFVAENSQYLNLLEVNLPAANRLAKALESNLKVPGLHAENKPITSFARRTR